MSGCLVKERATTCRSSLVFVPPPKFGAFTILQECPDYQGVFLSDLVCSFCQLAHLGGCKGQGDDHDDHVDVLQRVLELPYFSVCRWSFRIEASNNHTDDDDAAAEDETQ